MPIIGKVLRDTFADHQILGDARETSSVQIMKMVRRIAPFFLSDITVLFPTAANMMRYPHHALGLKHKNTPSPDSYIEHLYHLNMRPANIHEQPARRRIEIPDFS